MKFDRYRFTAVTVQSRPVRALWIEITKSPLFPRVALSRPVRALWIEMSEKSPVPGAVRVEAREGLVD